VTFSTGVNVVGWDAGSLRLAQSITVGFQDGGSKPEVVTLYTIMRQSLGFGSIQTASDV